MKARRKFLRERNDENFISFQTDKCFSKTQSPWNVMWNMRAFLPAPWRINSVTLKSVWMAALRVNSDKGQNVGWGQNLDHLRTTLIWTDWGHTVSNIGLHSLHTVRFYELCQNPFVTKVACTLRGEPRAFRDVLAWYGSGRFVEDGSVKHRPLIMRFPRTGIWHIQIQINFLHATVSPSLCVWQVGLSNHIGAGMKPQRRNYHRYLTRMEIIEDI